MLRWFQSYILFAALSITSNAIPYPGGGANGTINGTKTFNSVYPDSGSRNRQTSLSNTAKATYVPAVHWDLDREDLEHLRPNHNITFMYAHPEANISSGLVHAAFTNFKFKYPVVPLEHSSHVDDVSCTGTSSLQIKFLTKEAYEVALKWWPQNNFILAGHGYHSCDSVLGLEDRFWAHVSTVEYSDKDRTAYCRISHVSIKDAAETLDLTWGAHVSNQKVKNTNTASRVKSKRSFKLQKGTGEPPIYRYKVARAVTKNGPELAKRAACNRDNLFRSMLTSTQLASSFCSEYLFTSGTKTIISSVTVTSNPLPILSVSTIVKSVQEKKTVTITSIPKKVVLKTASMDTTETLNEDVTRVVTVSDTLTTSVSMKFKRAVFPAVWLTYAPSAITSACSCAVSVAMPQQTVTVQKVLPPKTITTKTTLVSTYTVTLQPTKVLATQTITSTVSTDVRTYKTVITSYKVSATTLIVQTVTVPIYPSYTGPTVPDFDVTDLEKLGDFDEMLDDTLGYMNTDDSAFWESFAPGLLPSTAGLMKRFFLDDIVDAVVDNVFRPIGDFFVDLGNAIVVGVKAIVSLIPPIPITPLYFNFGVDIDPAYLDYDWSEADTPFGDGVEMFAIPQSFGLYCVDCEMKAHFYALGTFSYHLGSNTITRGIVEFNTQFYLSLQFAFVIKDGVEREWEKTLLEAPIGGLVIPQIVTIGPSVELSIGAEASASIYGGVLTGFVYDWSPAVKFDFIDLKNSYLRGNVLPSIKDVFKIQAGITAKAEAFTLFKVNFGINFFKGALEIGASINNQPGVEAEMQYVIASAGDQEDDDDECDGVSVGISFKNEIFLGFDFFDTKFKLPFYTYKKPLMDECLTLDAGSSLSTSTTSTITSVPPAATISTSTAASSTTILPAARINLESRNVFEAYCPEYNGKLVTNNGQKLINDVLAGGSAAAETSIHYLVTCGLDAEHKGGFITSQQTTIGGSWAACKAVVNNNKCYFGAVLYPARGYCELLQQGDIADTFNSSLLWETDLRGYETQTITRMYRQLFSATEGSQLLYPQFRMAYDYKPNPNIGFVIMTNIDFIGGNITSVRADNMAKCIDACIEYVGDLQCVAVTFMQDTKYTFMAATPGTCYFKYEATIEAMNVNWNSGSTQLRNWTWSAYSGNLGLKPKNAAVCPGRDRQYYTTANLKTYYIRCDTAIWGWTASVQDVPDFNSCVELCSKTTGCVAATWWHADDKKCYLKNGFDARSLQVRVYIN
ncbi:hypothetical protein H072_910 [Dactylellina haptotyla CBS 200.50]|uniref:Apple domain-containing protein n=1 Tax=Dactylellina haptotyla (strain CBS 200.50) TaxID=1284197 RepID=S8CBM0_DACHA|nr:hypothetical protein H072_910 [Dactylellina haptotyla CBS 200.50]